MFKFLDLVGFYKTLRIKCFYDYKYKLCLLKQMCEHPAGIVHLKPSSCEKAVFERIWQETSAAETLRFMVYYTKCAIKRKLGILKVAKEN